MTTRTEPRSPRRPQPGPGPRQVGQAPRATGPDRRLLLAIGLCVLALIGIGAAIAAFRSGDGSAGTDADSTEGTVEPLAVAPVSVAGEPLAELVSTDDDPASAGAAPVLSGLTVAGLPITVGHPGQPTLVAFLAHWCPHCQRELPVLVELTEAGAFTGVRTVAVLTGTDTRAPNYPPAAWLASEGWTGEVLVDDEAFTAAGAYGLSGYPFLVFLDAEGRVVARTSGELPASEITALLAQAAG